MSLELYIDRDLHSAVVEDAKLGDLNMSEESSGGFERLYRKMPGLIISSNGIAVIDPMSWDEFVVKSSPGTYAVEVFSVQPLGEETPRISRVRVARGAGRRTGKTLGKVGVDAATIGILDARALQKGTQVDEGAVEGSWQSGEAAGLIQWGDDEDDVMVYMTTGYGDGTFDVTEIAGAEGPVGFEIQFIKVG